MQWLAWNNFWSLLQRKQRSFEFILIDICFKLRILFIFDKIRFSSCTKVPIVILWISKSEKKCCVIWNRFPNKCHVLCIRQFNVCIICCVRWTIISTTIQMNSNKDLKPYRVIGYSSIQKIIICLFIFPIGQISIYIIFKL